MRIGAFGGTFDPIHLGHLIAAEEVCATMELDKVLFVPTGQPWLKSDRMVTPARQRLEMLRLAVESNPYFEVSTVDIDRPGPSYTVDTMSDLSRQLPDAKLFFIAGLDALAELPRWREPARLLRMCQVVGMRRPGCTHLDLACVDEEIPDASRSIRIIEVPQIAISASEIRRRVAEGMPIRYQVPGVVEEYIRQNGLYKNDER